MHKASTAPVRALSWGQQPDRGIRIDAKTPVLSDSCATGHSARTTCFRIDSKPVVGQGRRRSYPVRQEIPSMLIARRCAVALSLLGCLSANSARASAVLRTKRRHMRQSPRLDWRHAAKQPQGPLGHQTLVVPAAGPTSEQSWAYLEQRSKGSGDWLELAAADLHAAPIESAIDHLALLGAFVAANAHSKTTTSAAAARSQLAKKVLVPVLERAVNSDWRALRWISGLGLEASFTFVAAAGPAYVPAGLDHGGLMAGVHPYVAPLKHWLEVAEHWADPLDNAAPKPHMFGDWHVGLTSLAEVGFSRLDRHFAAATGIEVAKRGKERGSTQNALMLPRIMPFSITIGNRNEQEQWAQRGPYVGLTWLFTPEQVAIAMYGVDATLQTMGVQSSLGAHMGSLAAALNASGLLVGVHAGAILYHDKLHRLSAGVTRMLNRVSNRLMDHDGGLITGTVGHWAKATLQLPDQAKKLPALAAGALAKNTPRSLSWRALSAKFASFF